MHSLSTRVRKYCDVCGSAIKRFVIEACGRQLWLAMNPRSGPSAHPAFASGYGGQAAEGYT